MYGNGFERVRTYRFHVRAYDALGNLTTYLDPTASYADKRVGLLRALVCIGASNHGGAPAAD